MTTTPLPTSDGRRFWPRWLWSLIRDRAVLLRFAIAASVFVVYVFAVAVLLPRPEMVSTLSAISERLTVTVVDQRQASFIIGRAALFGTEEPNSRGRCVAGMVRPVDGSKVVYSRLSSTGGILIEITPPQDDDQTVAAEFLPSDGRSPPEALRGTIVFDPDGLRSSAGNPTPCEGGQPVARLPIHGRLRLAEEQQPPARPRHLSPSLLHSGTLDVSARALVDPFGFARPTIYPVTTIRLPVGTRLEVPPTHNRDPNSFWWGFVAAAKEQPALAVTAATEAPAFVIYQPGQSRPITIEVGLLLRLFDDPNLARLQVLAAAVLLIMQWAGSVASLVEARRKLAAEAAATGERHGAL